MHTLNKVLVRVFNGSISLCDEDWDREDIIESARSFAESETEEYYPQVFDWRETATAGGWADKYPENVLLSKEDICRFIKELEESLEDQLHEMRYRLDNICKVSANIKELFDLEYNTHTEHTTVPTWDLLRLSELMFGVYNCDSGFYDTDEYGAKITKKTIDKVKESPNDWALVMFDYHY